MRMYFCDHCGREIWRGLQTEEICCGETMKEKGDTECRPTGDKRVYKGRWQRKSRISKKY